MLPTGFQNSFPAWISLRLYNSSLNISLLQRNPHGSKNRARERDKVKEMVH